MKFSIAIPAYKSQFLKEAISSCLSQTYNDFELVIVNDCSPEDIDSIVSSFRDSRIRYYTNGKNCGAMNVVDNWNKCLDYVRGEYVVCMGDDDRLLPYCLEEYAILIEKYPHLDIYHAKTEVIDEGGNLLEIQESQSEWESAYSILYHKCHCNRILYIGDWLFRVNALRSQGGFYNLPYAIFSDNISAIRASMDKGVANTRVICFQYRQHSQTISNNPHARDLAFASRKAYDWFLSFLQKMPHSLEDRKYRELLISRDLHRYVYDIIKYLVRKDFEQNKDDAMCFWDKEYSKVGLSDEEYKSLSKEYRSLSVGEKISLVKYVIKRLFCWY